MGYEEYLKESIYNHKTGIKRNPIDDIGYKLKGHKLAEKLGVKTTIIYGIYKNIDEVCWEDLPYTFTIKPQGAVLKVECFHWFINSGINTKTF